MNEKKACGTIKIIPRRTATILTEFSISVARKEVALVHNTTPSTEKNVEEKTWSLSSPTSRTFFLKIGLPYVVSKKPVLDKYEVGPVYFYTK